jgi:pyruvate dehydrogenase E1 component alpha subunit
MQRPEQRDEVEMLALMLLIRRFEERASQQYQAQKIGGFCHLYIGQEAVVTGAVAAVRDDDYIITAYRDHAHALARGTSADACMAELFGKETGCSRGLGGSMHFFDRSHHMYGGHAIVGAHVPLAAGMAFASKYRGEDRVTLCFFGDGAINQGSFHEALNLIALYKLPVVLICENNLFAMGTSVKRSTSLKQIVDRAEGYDIPGEIVDGMNFREVRDKLAEIVDSIRKDPHPAFVEIRTYRYRGHSMSDPASYRTKEELEKYRLDDPITRLRAQLTREGKLTNEQFDQLDKKAKEAALASVKFAEKSPELPLEKLYDYTYLKNRPGERDHLSSSAQRSARGRIGARPECFPHGRGGRGVSRRLQSEPGLARALRPKTNHRHANQRKRFRRVGSRRGDGWTAADHRIHDLQLLPCRIRPGGKQRAQHVHDVRRAVQCSDYLSRAQRTGSSTRRHPFTRHGMPLLECSRIESVHTSHTQGRKRLVKNGGARR